MSQLEQERHIHFHLRFQTVVASICWRDSANHLSKTMQVPLLQLNVEISDWTKRQWRCKEEQPKYWKVKLICTYRDVCTPRSALKPVEPTNSMEETGESWCAKTTVAPPPPEFPLTATFPPIDNVLRFDIWDWTVLVMAILTCMYWTH